MSCFICNLTRFFPSSSCFAFRRLAERTDCVQIAASATEMSAKRKCYCHWRVEHCWPNRRELYCTYRIAGRREIMDAATLIKIISRWNHGVPGSIVPVHIKVRRA